MSKKDENEPLSWLNQTAQPARPSDATADSRWFSIPWSDPEFLGRQPMRSVNPFSRAAQSAQSDLEFERKRTSVAMQLIEDYKKVNKTLVDSIEELSKAASTIAIVSEVNAQDVIVQEGTRSFAVSTPSEKIGKVKVGDRVALIEESRQIARILPPGQPAGEVVQVANVLPNNLVEVAGLGGGRVVAGVLDKVRAGDRVVLDSSNTIITCVLPRPRSVYEFADTVPIDWADIAGQDDAVAALREAVEGPRLQADKYARWGRKPPRGILVYGPPGTGKTLFARASATALARLNAHQGEPNAPILNSLKSSAEGGFFYVRGPQILSKWVGESEGSIRSLFQAARDHRAETGQTALIFIDEAESILGRRGESQSIMTNTIVPQFLSELDGLEDPGCLLLLATNRPGDLDPAIVRDGRVDLKVRVGRPDRKGTEAIAKLYLQPKPCAESYESLASLLANDIHEREVGKIYMYASNDNQETRSITLSAFSSGAMIRGIVERSCALAMVENAEALEKRHILEACKEAELTLANLDLTDALKDAANGALAEFKPRASVAKDNAVEMN